MISINVELHKNAKNSHYMVKYWKMLDSTGLLGL